MPLRDDILQPISEANPGGENLRYAPVFDKIKEARRQDDDAPQGDWQIELKVADYPLVVKLASEAIATKSKDLQIAAWLTEALGGPADIVLSDMAANTVGHPQTDHLRTMGLVEAGMDFACQELRPGGVYVAKVLAGGADNDLVAELKRNFTAVKHAKPPASRKDSSEWYVIAKGFKGA